MHETSVHGNHVVSVNASIALTCAGLHSIKRSQHAHKRMYMSYSESCVSGNLLCMSQMLGIDRITVNVVASQGCAS